MTCVTSSFRSFFFICIFWHSRLHWISFELLSLHGRRPAPSRNNSSTPNTFWASSNKFLHLLSIDSIGALYASTKRHNFKLDVGIFITDMNRNIKLILVSLIHINIAGLLLRWSNLRKLVLLNILLIMPRIWRIQNLTTTSGFMCARFDARRVSPSLRPRHRLIFWLDIWLNFKWLTIVIWLSLMAFSRVNFVVCIKYNSRFSLSWCLFQLRPFRSFYCLMT